MTEGKRKERERERRSRALEAKGGGARGRGEGRDGGIGSRALAFAGGGVFPLSSFAAPSFLRPTTHCPPPPEINQHHLSSELRFPCFILLKTQQLLRYFLCKIYVLSFFHSKVLLLLLFLQSSSLSPYFFTQYY